MSSCFKIHPGQYVLIVPVNPELCNREEFLVLRVRKNALIVAEPSSATGYAEIRWYVDKNVGYYSFEFPRKDIKMTCCSRVTLVFDGQNISGLFMEDGA